MIDLASFEAEQLDRRLSFTAGSEKSGREPLASLAEIVLAPAEDVAAATAKPPNIVRRYRSISVIDLSHAKKNGAVSMTAQL
ncbi:MAG: hypothetical protein FJX59_20765 [Alphaproteobacteria bacterium]|nr:hypothetical protein [Alphaproteobacteria bacterium]